MIRSLSESLRNLLTLSNPGQAARFPELAGAAVKFDRPTDPYEIDRTTINLYLYDVREDLDFRLDGPDRALVNGQLVIRRPPLRVKCSYLITAWPFGGSELELQQHRLLSQVLAIAGGRDVVPASALTGEVAAQSPAPTLSVARTDPIGDLTDVWSSIGNKIRPSLTLSSTIAIDAIPAQPITPVRSHLLRIGSRLGSDGTVLAPGDDLETFEIAGRVVDGAANPLEGAVVSVDAIGLRVSTEADGRFRLGPLRPGDHTLTGRLGGLLGERTIVLKHKTSEIFDLTLTPTT